VSAPGSAFPSGPQPSAADAPPADPDDAAPGDASWHSRPRNLLLSIALFLLTLLSTTYVGSLGAGGGLWSGLNYALPLMSILLAHELGHYVAARIHRVPASPPYFIPFPLPSLGTMGAVILMRGRIARRNALLDIGAAGPLAGMVVALPVLIYGMLTSPVLPLPAGESYELEGRSLLYLALLKLTKGTIPDGFDIMLSPVAFAGWAGLMVTMINLIPAAQLDGGHVAYALFGERQERYSRWLRRALLPMAAIVSLIYGIPELIAGARGEALVAGFAPGMPWLLWWVVLRLIVGQSKREHPQTDDDRLSPGRRIVAVGTLLLFVLLFMPAWMRTVTAAPAASATSAQR
jgi:membrane-associated protease RseP (regulator of RpoE activity)